MRRTDGSSASGVCTEAQLTIGAVLPNLEELNNAKPYYLAKL